MVERVARAVCSRSCLRAEVFGEPCIAPDGTDGPCQATPDQLFLSWRWDAAERAIRAMREPTEAMIDAIDSAGYHVTCERQFVRAEIRREWGAGIDAAVESEEAAP